jgi:hypothetical protein
MSSYPPDPYQPQDYPPGSYSSGPPEHDPYATPSNAISGRVVPPAITLLIVAILNLIFAAGTGFFGCAMGRMPEDKFEQALRQQNPKAFNDMQQQGWSVQDMLKIYLYGGLAWGGVSLFVSLLTILGAIRMMALKSYGLSVFVAILSAIPCISPAACPCIFGMGIGIWALVVLLTPEVRAAFR